MPEWGVIVLIPATILAMILIISLAKNHETSMKLIKCTKDNATSESVEGIIRKASSGYYIYNDRWRFIVNGCPETSKAKNCLQKNPGITALEANIGKFAVVKFCNTDAIEYLILGIKYNANNNKPIN